MSPFPTPKKQNMSLLWSSNQDRAEPSEAFGTETRSGGADPLISVGVLGIGMSRWLPATPRLLPTLPWYLSLLCALSHAATGHSADMENHWSTYLSLSHSGVCKVMAEASRPRNRRAHKNLPSPCAALVVAEAFPRGAQRSGVCQPRTLFLRPTGSPARVSAAAPQWFPRMAGLLVPGASDTPASS